MKSRQKYIPAEKGASPKGRNKINPRHEGVAQAYIADPERIGWRAYKSVYPNSSQHAAETGFSRLLKNVEFAARVVELQGAAATNAEITLGSLLREVGEIQQAAMAAKQYSAANGAVKLKAELSGHYVQRKEDVTPRRSEAEVIARLREILGSGDEAGSSETGGGAAKLRASPTLN
jgi:hypothetical protein